MSLKVGVLGSQGRMGREILTALASPQYAGRASLHASADQGDPLAPLLEADAIIDFSSAGAATALVSAAESAKKYPALVCGTTGWKIDEKRILEKYAEKAPVVLSANFSIGVLLVMETLKKCAPVLTKLGYTPVIVEAHHKNKLDAPSGTALTLQRMISLSPGNCQTHSIRAGEVVGDHEVTFYGAGDHITIGHFAQSRSIFATGAIDVALWVHSQFKSGKLTHGLMGLEPFVKDLFP